MHATWRLLGQFSVNDQVADVLNAAHIGVGAAVALTIERTQFAVWGNDQSPVLPGHVWRALSQTEGKPASAVAQIATAAGAVSAAVTVNANGDWVLWGYVPA